MSKPKHVDLQHIHTKIPLRNHSPALFTKESHCVIYEVGVVTDS